MTLGTRLACFFRKFGIRERRTRRCCQHYQRGHRSSHNRSRVYSYFKVRSSYVHDSLLQMTKLNLWKCVFCINASPSLFKLSAAGGAQFLNVLGHAYRNTWHVRNFIAAKFERVRCTRPPLFGRAFGLRVSGSCRGHNDTNCYSCKPNQLCHCDISSFRSQAP